MLFAVENAPDVFIQAGFAVVAHLVDMFTEKRAQSIFCRFAVFPRTAGIDQQLSIGNSELTEIMHQHGNTFSVEFRRDPADVFHADLMKLTASSGGGAFPAEHRAHVEHALFIAVHDIGAQQRPHDAGGAFRAQRQAASSAVVETVHFLLHDFSLVADSALEHFSVFKYRSPQFAVAVQSENGSGCFLQAAP